MILTFYVEIVVVDGLVGEVVGEEVVMEEVGEVVFGVVVILALAYTFMCRRDSCGFRDFYACSPSHVASR